MHGVAYHNFGPQSLECFYVRMDHRDGFPERRRIWRLPISILEAEKFEARAKKVFGAEYLPVPGQWQDREGVNAVGTTREVMGVHLGHPLADEGRGSGCCRTVMTGVFARWIFGKLVSLCLAPSRPDASFRNIRRRWRRLGCCHIIQADQNVDHGVTNRIEIRST